MNMKAFGKRLLGAVIVSSMIVTPVMAAPSVDDLKQDKQEAESEVNSLQSKLNEIVGKINQLELDLIAKGEEIAQAEEDLEEAEALEMQQYEDMKLRIKFMYEEGDTSFVEALMSADDFTDLVNKAEYVQNVHSYDRQKLQEYVETKQKVADLKSTLETEQANMESMQADYETQESDLNTLIDSKQAEVADLTEQIQAAVEQAAREAEERQRQATLAANNNNNSGNSSNKGNGGSSGGSYVSAGNTATAQKIVNAAYSQLGVDYVWGGSTPGSALDCSGLVQYCHKVAGISLSHSSGAQGSGGQAVSNPQPGDVVCYSGHVGIYVGGGQMIHAPHTGDVVKKVTVYGNPWYRRYW